VARATARTSRCPGCTPSKLPMTTTEPATSLLRASDACFPATPPQPKPGPRSVRNRPPQADRGPATPPHGGSQSGRPVPCGPKRTPEPDVVRLLGGGLQRGEQQGGDLTERIGRQRVQLTRGKLGQGGVPGRVSKMERADPGSSQRGEMSAHSQPCPQVPCQRTNVGAPRSSRRGHRGRSPRRRHPPRNAHPARRTARR
jgi:hypothetical protein